MPRLPALHWSLGIRHWSLHACAFITLFDTWRPEARRQTGYGWLPVRFTGDRFTIKWHDRWDFSIFSS
jgi:hypothetical protein